MLPTLIIFAYLIGSVSTAIIVCRIMNLPDPRTQGSKNPGATNVLRIAGKKAAAVVLIGDGLKGVIPVLLAMLVLPDIELFNLCLIALAAFLGHVYPIFFKFQGGKGVATFIGALITINLWAGLGFILTWLFVAKVLKISSLSALVATLLTPVYFYYTTQDLDATYAIVVICVWIFITHRSNIKRLLSGEEGVIKS